MAVTITCLNDTNHSISSTKKILSRQGELGEVLTFEIPTALAATYGLAWIMVQQPDGQIYYIDNGSDTGFDHATTDSFTYAIGDRDTMLSTGGTLGLQVVLRDAAPPSQTVEWRSRILNLTIEDSILSNVDSGGSLIDSLSSGTLDRLADIQYDSLADGDLLYRDTATGKWRNVTLVDGANISHVLNKTTGELTLQAIGNISTLAKDLVYTDAGGYFIGSDGETIGQEIGSQLASKANIAAPTFTGLITTAGQIKFPATRSASSDPNTLDDYEEGTFTPFVYGSTTPGTATYSIQTGYYTKIGRSVNISLNLIYTEHTGTGVMRIGGLPFSVNLAGSNPINTYHTSLTSPANTVIQTLLTGTEVRLYSVPVGGGSSTLLDLDTDCQVRISGIYTTNE